MTGEPWQPFPRRPGQNRWLVWLTRRREFVVIRAGKTIRAFGTSAGATAFIRRCERLAVRLWARRWAAMFEGGPL